MFEVFILRIIAGILLASSFLLIYVVNFRGNNDDESYKARKEVPIATASEVAGGIVTIIVPMVSIILLVLIPMSRTGRFFPRIKEKQI